MIPKGHLQYGVLSDDGSANNGTLNLAGTSITIALTAGSGTITYDCRPDDSWCEINALQLSGSGTITVPEH